MLWWILQNLAIAGLLAGLVSLVSRVGRIGPVGRHALWLVVLLKLLTPPLIVLPWPWAMPASHDIANRLLLANPLASDAVPTARVETRAFTSNDARHLAESAPSGAVMSAVVSAGPGTATRRGSDPRTTRGSADFRALVSALLPTAMAHPLGLWLFGGLVFASIQCVRIGRVVRRVREADADRLLSDQVATLACGLRMRPVRVRVVPAMTSPLIWSVNPFRPQLLWPAGLSSQLSDDCQRGLIVHELAHVKRRDHWVGWLELVTGCAWWWNPLFWYVRSRLRENAELACDGWVVETLPHGRRAYADALLAVCAGTVMGPAPMPAMGISTSTRRLLEKRLAMIMRDRVPLRLSRTGLWSLVLLTLAILPAWAQRLPRAPNQDRQPPSLVDRDLATVSVAMPVAAPDPLRLTAASQPIDRSSDQPAGGPVQPVRQTALNQAFVFAAQVPTSVGPILPLTIDDAVKLAVDHGFPAVTAGNTYWDFVYATEAVASARQLLALSAQLVANNRTRVEVGSMAPLDVVTAQREQATNERALLTADASRQTAELAVKRLVVSRIDDPLWTATLDPIDRRAFRPELTEVAATLDRARRAIAQPQADEITAAAVTVQNTAESWRLAQVSQLPAQQAFDAEQRKFDGGASTNYNVVLAQRNLNDVRMGELRAVLGYRKAQIEFDRLQAPQGANASAPARFAIDVAPIRQNAAVAAQDNPPTVCGSIQIPRPLGIPPDNSGPVLFQIVPCFAAQVGTPLVNIQTYIQYMHITQTPSRPSQGIWTPYDAALEQTIRDDYNRLWGTNFLAHLSIDTTDYTFANGVVGKIVVYNMEERPRVKIVDYVGSKKLAISKIETRLRQEHAELRLDTFLDEATVRKAQTVVHDMMVEKGLKNAAVTTEIQPMSGNPQLVHLTFHLDEGPPKGNR